MRIVIALLLLATSVQAGASVVRVEFTAEIVTDSGTGVYAASEGLISGVVIYDEATGVDNTPRPNLGIHNFDLPPSGIWISIPGGPDFNHAGLQIAVENDGGWNVGFRDRVRFEADSGLMTSNRTGTVGIWLMDNDGSAFSGESIPSIETLAGMGIPSELGDEPLWDIDLSLDDIGFPDCCNRSTSKLKADLVSVSFSAVPIPAAAWLFGSALGILGWMRRRAS